LTLGAIFFCFFIFSSSAGSELVLHDTFKRDYRIRNVDTEAVDTKNRRFFMFTEYSIRTEETTIDGRKLFLVNCIEKTGEGDVKKWRMYIDPVQVRMIRIESDLISRDGKMLESRVEYYGNHFYEYPANSGIMQLFPYASQSMDFQEGAITEFNVIFSPEFEPWVISLMVDGEETVTVPAGTFECIRIKVKYNKENLPGFFKILPSFLLNQFFPDVFMWVEKDAPHTMIKLQGKLEGFSSPEKVYELIEVEKDGKASKGAARGR
jgi:hypothetical protein